MKLTLLALINILNAQQLVPLPWKKPLESYYSQFGQDYYVYNTFFSNKRDGIFVDIGAAGGISMSNTYFFEKIGWTGLCIEARKNIFDLLVKSRPNSICLNCAVGKENKEENFFDLGYISGFLDTYTSDSLYGFFKAIKDKNTNFVDSNGNMKYEIYKLKCINFNKLCIEQNINHIDFLSIDIEGAEIEVLSSIDFEKIDIDCMAVENTRNKHIIRNFLEKNNFILVKRLLLDDIFISKKFAKTNNINGTIKIDD